MQSYELEHWKNAKSESILWAFKVPTRETKSQISQSKLSIQLTTCPLTP